MKKIAFITSQDDPTLIQDDQLAIAPLKKLGYTAVPLVWDGEAQEIESFDALIFRSCWNYHQKFDQFLEWVNGLKKYNIPVFNSIDVSLWNLNKKYLLELAKKGAAIPRTEWFPKGTQFGSNDLKEIIERVASDKIVIKPAVSLNGHDTYLVSTKDVAKVGETLRMLPADRDILVQEFIPEIKVAGEISLIFFNNEFSHAIRKTPAANEFRIHSEYGGQRTSMEPSPELIVQAQDILKMAARPLLFSRVDVVEREQGAVLIELEIVDPMLFLGTSKGAADRFAAAIASLIK